MHMLKKLKEGIEKVKKTTHKPHGNTSINEKNRKSKKKPPPKIQELKKYNNWNKKFTSGIQDLFEPTEKENQQTGRQHNGKGLKKRERRLRVLYHHQTDRHAHCGDPRGRERKGRNITWIMVEVEQLRWKTNINIQKLNKFQAGKAQRPTVRHTIKLLKAKDNKRILKAAREKQLVTHKGSSVRFSADFSSETLEDRGKWAGIF